MAEIKNQVSNLCLPRLTAVTGGIGTHMEYLQRTKECDGGLGMGYDGGYEITPTRAFVADHLRYLVTGRKISQPDQLLYSSVHQSWARGSDTLPLVGVHASLATMKNMADTDGLPAVVYAGHTHKGQAVDFAQYGFSEVTVQPVADMLGALNVTMPSHYETRLWPNLQQTGVTGLTIDPHHLLRAHKDNADVRINRTLLFNTIKDQKIPIRRVHVSAGRVDAKEDADRKRSMQDLHGLVTGKLASTALGDVLVQTHDIWREQNAGNPDAVLPVVVEIPLKGLFECLSQRFGQADATRHLRGAGGWAGTHGIISHNVRAFYKTLPAPDAA